MRSFPQVPSPPPAPPALYSLWCNSCLPSLPCFQATQPGGFICMSAWVTGEMLACQDEKNSPGFNWHFFPSCVLANGQDDRYNHHKVLLTLYTYTIFRFCPTHLRLDLTARTEIFISLFSGQHKEQERCCHLKGLFVPTCHLESAGLFLSVSLPVLHRFVGWLRGGSKPSALGLSSCCSTRE